MVSNDLTRDVGAVGMKGTKMSDSEEQIPNPIITIK